MEFAFKNAFPYLERVEEENFVTIDVNGHRLSDFFWELTDTQRYRLILIHLFVPLDRDQSYFPVLWQVEASKENAPNLNRNVWKITISVPFLKVE